MFSDTPAAPAGLFGFINPAGLYDPSANGYSHVAVVRLPARVIHVAGQGGETADGVLSPRFEVQVAQALDNLALALAAAGGWAFFPRRSANAGRWAGHRPAR
jgi:enamine deaminase RidA (YjgF/YER057c/UK114 family)